MTVIENLYELSKGSPSDYARNYIEHLVGLLKSLDYKSIGSIIEILREARSRGNTVFFLGNGGSAAASAHFANDMTVTASPEGKPPLRAMCLASNSSVITCLANDFGYEHVFSRQLQNLMRPGDVVVGISASGNSPNAVNALEYARNNGAVSIALVGFDGGKMKEVADHCVHISTTKGEYGPVEDVHMVLDHLVSTFLAHAD